MALGDAAATRPPAIERALAEARIAYGHEALGAMDTALRTTAEYLKTRKQFGVTLNKFQALTFRAADMYVSLELARSIALWASMVQEAGGDVVQAADRARLQTSRAGRHIGKEAIQLHGGIGVTAEYSRRALHQPAHRDRPPARRRRLGPGPAGRRTWRATRRSTRWAPPTPEGQRANLAHHEPVGPVLVPPADAAAMSRALLGPTGR